MFDDCFWHSYFALNPNRSTMTLVRCHDAGSENHLHSSFPADQRAAAALLSMDGQETAAAALLSRGAQETGEGEGFRDPLQPKVTK